jgi:hypothetical protein
MWIGIVNVPYTTENPWGLWVPGGYAKALAILMTGILLHSTLSVRI